MTDRPAIGLVLSGGSLKAAAHIGAIRALETFGLKPDMVAGTSAGAFVAALHAHGCTYEELIALVKTFPGQKLLDYGFPLGTYLRHRLARYAPARWEKALHTNRISGLFKGDKLETYIRERFEHRTAVMPFFIVSTDLLSGQPVVFSNHNKSIVKGRAVAIIDLPRSVLASCALPGIFDPVELGPWLLVDGAIRHYAPVHVLREAGCQHIIVINLHVLKTDWQPDHIVDVLSRSFEVMLRETIEDDTMGPDVTLIEPEVSHVKWTSFGELSSCVNAGFEAVQQSAMIEQLRSSQQLRTASARGRSISPIVRFNAAQSQ